MSRKLTVLECDTPGDEDNLLQRRTSMMKKSQECKGIKGYNGSGFDGRKQIIDDVIGLGDEYIFPQNTNKEKKFPRNVGNKD